MTMWRPRTMVIYAVMVKAFQDSDRDGIGDIRGLIERLDYLQQLGVTCLWILPCYPSGGRDNGYDITNYIDVSPDYGTLDDFRELVQDVHRRDMRVVVDLVVHHTSNRHPWFQASRQRARSPYRDYYVWADEPPDGPQPVNIFPTVEPGVWHYDEIAERWYFHLFYKEEPDLNFANPVVRQRILEIIEFWMTFGVDGFRIDALNHLFEAKGLPGTGSSDNCDILGEIRAVLRSHNPEAFLIAEADTDLQEVESFCCDGDGIQLFFNFTLDNYIFLALARESAQPMLEGLDLAPPHPHHWTWLNFLRNLDELDLEQLSPGGREDVWRRFAPDPEMRSYDRGIRRRLAPMLGGDLRRIECVYSLLFSLPGVPLIVYGDEIGMGDDLAQPEREAVRAPMQWDAGPFGGFSDRAPHPDVNPLIETGPFRFERINVASQIDDPDSLLCFIQKLAAMRHARPWLAEPELEAGSIFQENQRVLAFAQRNGDHRLVTLHNFSSNVQTIPLAAVNADDSSLVLADTETAIDSRHVCLGPYGYAWLE